MPSELTFSATQGFRKNLIKRNLPPYKTGYRGNDNAGEKELVLKDRAPHNNPDIDDLLITQNSQRNAFTQNAYGPDGGYYDIDLDDVHRKIRNQEEYYTFIASTYTAFNILTRRNPNGDNGSLREDSDLSRLAAKSLKTQFQYRIGEEIRQQTLGRVNVLDALSDPFDALAIATGREQLIESDWKISVPDNVVGKGLDFLSRISGVYSPYSWIPGDYFNEVVPQSSINQSVDSGEFGERATVLPQANTRSSEQFLSSTGRGQTKRLFKSLDLNVYSPDYTENSRSFGLKPPPGNYYIGSKERNPRDVVSPPTELPIDQYGNRVRIPVRGYSELARDYENKISSNNFKFGLNGTKYLRDNTLTNSNYDAPRLQGGFTWTSEESEKAAGRHVSQGGELGSVDTNFESSVQSTWQGTSSKGYGFTPGSILDDTQRLVDSADKLSGLARLQHVGNAINQVSKVFNDGTREMTKGSMVYQYTDSESGLPVGVEYCRVFTKDVPYFSNSELQKREGMVNENRRFTNSVLNNTYNLNIAPWRDQDSSNIQESRVKKYMFSIENLAWRTSSKKGFTYQDLPVCERGPNGGRIMWFPPYDMKVSEQNSTNWTANEFLGRPEPIYTYNNTTRQGSLSWKLVVDHPSILNDIVKKRLDGENTQLINDVVDSFFAGCKTYDVNELAETYTQFTTEEITEIITKVTDVTEYEYWEKQIQSPGDPIITEPVIEEYTKEILEEDYNYEFYFDNDIPPKTSSTDQDTTEEPYQTSISKYIGIRGEYFATANENQKIPVDNFFETYITTGDSGFNLIEYKTKILAQKIRKAIEKGARVNITLKGSASAPNSVAYNEHLSKRRIDSVKKYLLGFSELSKFSEKLKIDASAEGKQSTATPGGTGGPFKCDEAFENENDEKYSVRAMACRAVVFGSIEEIPPEPGPAPTPIVEEAPPIITTVTGRTPYTYQKFTNEERTRIEVTEQVFKKLMTECDYFDMMREDHPRVYQGIKEKIKFFQPVFHSMTPEGLNSRLTFLQQCLRPGDTIPVIGEDGKPREGDVKNTAFGAPPICVLRIGDFYHTKIAINQMSINYEPLTFDLNPEGIGVQPMIADVNISFYFIGGQGIEEPVSRLQNALTFNYFANTEVYDDRSIDTETRKEITADDITQINDATGNITDSRAEVPEEAGDTIGEVIGTRLEGDYAAGDVIYKSVMRDMVNKSQSYTQNIINTLDTINKNQSSIGMYYFTQERGFKDGLITGYLNGTDELSVNIFGKPVNIEDSTIELTEGLLKDITDDANPFLSSISLENFKNSDIRKFKKNLRSFVQQYVNEFSTHFNSTIFDLLETQTEMVRLIDKFNLLTTETDGFKGKSGRISILELSGTSDVDVSSSQSNTYEELMADIQTIGFDLQAFYDEIFEDNGLLPKKNNLYKGFLFGSYDTEAQTRFCTIAFDIITKDPEKFKSLILGEELSEKTDWVNYVNKIIYGKKGESIDIGIGAEFEDGTNTTIIISEDEPGLVNVYKDLKQNSESAFNEFKDNENVKKFTLYQPFNLDKERKFNYVQKYQEQLSDQTKVEYFNKTFKGVNGGTILSYNEKYTFN